MFIDFLPTFCVSHLYFSYSIVNESRNLSKCTDNPFSLSFLLEAVEKKRKDSTFWDWSIFFLSLGGIEKKIKAACEQLHCVHWVSI